MEKIRRKKNWKILDLKIGERVEESTKKKAIEKWNTAVSLSQKNISKQDPKKNQIISQNKTNNKPRKNKSKLPNKGKEEEGKEGEEEGEEEGG